MMPLQLTDQERRDPTCPKVVPMALLDEATAQHNHGQTLLRLAERGGMGLDEVLALMDKRRWRPMAPEEALAELKKRLAL